MLKIAPPPAGTAAEFHDTERDTFDAIAEAGVNIATTLDDCPIIIVVVVVVVLVFFAFAFKFVLIGWRRRPVGMDATIFHPAIC